MCTLLAAVTAIVVVHFGAVGGQQECEKQLACW
jgi:hypothetical protein